MAHWIENLSGDVQCAERHGVLWPSSADQFHCFQELNIRRRKDGRDRGSSLYLRIGAELSQDSGGIDVQNRDQTGGFTCPDASAAGNVANTPISETALPSGTTSMHCLHSVL